MPALLNLVFKKQSWELIFLNLFTPFSELVSSEGRFSLCLEQLQSYILPVLYLLECFWLLVTEKLA